MEEALADAMMQEEDIRKQHDDTSDDSKYMNIDDKNYIYLDSDEDS